VPIKRAGISDNPFKWTVSHSMNYREPTHALRRWRKAWHCLSLALTTAAPVGLQSQPQPRPFIRTTKPVTEPAPYLRVTGAPALRFQEAAPPPDLVARPAAGASPTPALTPTESSVALANAAAAASAEPAATSPTSTAPATPEKPAGKTPAPILRDDVRPTVRPEDFLPYFQVPGAAQLPGEATPFVPAPRSAPTPATLPPSAATYPQPPR